MSETNPYAYQEAPKSQFSHVLMTDDGEAASASEPRTPTKLYLRHKQGLFSSTKCVMTVLANRLEVMGPHLNEPMVLERSDAQGAIKSLMTKIVVRFPAEGKQHFKFQKDEDRELKLARLETWANPDAERGDSAQMVVERSLKKWCSWTTWSNLVFLGILQTIGFLLMFLFSASDINEVTTDEERMFAIIGVAVVLLMGVFIMSVNFGSAILLAYRQTWVLLIVIIFYFIFTCLSLLTLNPLIIIISLVVLIQAYNARSRLKRLLRQLEDDNEEVFEVSEVM